MFELVFGVGLDLVVGLGLCMVAGLPAGSGFGLALDLPGFCGFLWGWYNIEFLRFCCCWVVFWCFGLGCF